MRSELGNNYRMEQSQKRKSIEEVLGVDANCFDMENLYNSVGGKSLKTEYMETESFNQMMEMPSSTFYKEINRIKVKLESLIIMVNYT